MSEIDKTEQNRVITINLDKEIPRKVFRKMYNLSPQDLHNWLTVRKKMPKQYGGYPLSKRHIPELDIDLIIIGDLDLEN